MISTCAHADVQSWNLTHRSQARCLEIEDRAFAAPGPRLSNSCLPTHVRRLDLSVYGELKTYLIARGTGT